MVNAALLLASIAAGIHLKKQGKLSLILWGLVTIEGLIYGLLLGKTVLAIMSHVHLLGTNPQEKMSVAVKIMMAAGAGYNEEMVFRLVPLGLALKFLPKLLPGKDFHQFGYLVLIVIIESVLFSVAHFIGVEEFSSMAFWYRFFSAILFSILLLTRGFTSAAYAHFLYDVIVMLR